MRKHAKVSMMICLVVSIVGYFVFLLLNQTPNFDTARIKTVPHDAEVSFFDQSINDASIIYVKVSHRDYVTQVVAIDKNDSSQTIQLKPRLFFDMTQDAVYKVNDIEVTFKAIPEGQFLMGNSEQKRAKPIRKIFVNAFRVMEHEVTWALYQKCIDDNACPDKQKDKAIGLSHPVTEVSWQEITTHFIPWFNLKTNSKFRLPSEAEWEYVARASSESSYHWGDEPELGLANCWGCGSVWDNLSTAPVKSFPANKFGVFDMHGNVWEWTADCYAYYDTLTFRDSRANIEKGCDRRVIRGGGYRFRPMFMDASFRGRDFAHVTSNSDGFRLAQGNF